MSINTSPTVPTYDEIQDPLSIIGQVQSAISQEIVKQDNKWGIRDLAIGDWWLIATEEDGEAAQAVVEGRYGDVERELVQAMAVRLRMIEKVRRMAKAVPPAPASVDGGGEGE